jgi:hypothetical protein
MAIKEFSLAELLDDPVVGLAMQRDGVERRTLERLLDMIGGILTDQTIDEPDRGTCGGNPL